MIVGDVTGMRIATPPRLALGQVYATPGALEVLERVGVSAASLLARHAVGDWGDVGPEDWQANERAVRDGDRVLSAYQVGEDGERVWVITEWDRSATTVLRPEEY